MTKFLAVLSFIILCAVGTQGAMAQVPNAGIPQFLPTKPWDVKPTALSEVRGINGVKLPCMMVADYDNGYTLRLSGGDQRFLAMAIDFRQSAFTQGRKYQAGVTLNNGFNNTVQATAFSNSVLIFNVRSFSGFYQALNQSSSMIIDIENNPFQFSLGNFSEASQRLEGCYSGKLPSASPNAPTPINAGASGGASAIGQAAPLPNNARSGVSVKPDWNNAYSANPSRGASSQGTSRGGVRAGVWEAKAGDDIRGTLERWSNRAGVDVQWQADRGGSVVSDVRVKGTFENAVQTLMAQNATVLGIEANIQGNEFGRASVGAPQPLTRSRISRPLDQPARGVSLQNTPAASSGAGLGNAKWHAPAGSNLQQVLKIWSREAGVDLLWHADQGFTVKRAVNANGSYESALQSLLGQFAQDGLRPAAQLNNDPVSGQRILFIESSRVL